MLWCRNSQTLSAAATRRFASRHLRPTCSSPCALGYSFESALAEIIGNSLSANARTIDVRFSPDDLPYVAVLDDGIGMLPDELTAAMRHGSSVRTATPTRTLSGGMLIISNGESQEKI